MKEATRKSSTSEKHHSHRHKSTKQESLFSKPIIAMVIVATLLLAFNQFQIASVSAIVAGKSGSTSYATGGSFSGEVDLSAVDVDSLKATGYTVAAVFPELAQAQNPDEVMAIMFPTGTPEYGKELGVSFDDPVNSLATLSNMYRGLKTEVQTNNLEGWQRFMNLALKPTGISCEFCCGLKAVGINAQGDSTCGCQHNPALLSVALYLSAYSDYDDGEILREVMKWKTLFFPKNMVELGITVAGGDASKLQNLPGMVGGC